MGVVNYLICHKVDYSCSICVSSLPDFILKVTYNIYSTKITLAHLDIQQVITNLHFFTYLTKTK